MSSTTSTTPGSDAFLNSLLGMVNHEDLVAILGAQSQMLNRFEKTNEMLSNFNRLSAKRYEKTFEQFKEHTETLLTMKKDLDSVFRRIRTLKRKLANDYPQAFVAALEDIVPPDLDEEEEGSRLPPSRSPSHQHQHPQQHHQHHHHHHQQQQQRPRPSHPAGASAAANDCPHPPGLKTKADGDAGRKDHATGSESSQGAHHIPGSSKEWTLSA